MSAKEICENGAPFRLVRRQEFPMEWVIRSRVGEDVATFEDETYGQAVCELMNTTAGPGAESLSRLAHQTWVQTYGEPKLK